jgi:hypothetical protein
LQSTDLTQNDTEDREDQQTDDEAKAITILAIVSDRDLRDCTAVVEDQDRDQ